MDTLYGIERIHALFQDPYKRRVIVVDQVFSAHWAEKLGFRGFVKKKANTALRTRIENVAFFKFEADLQVSEQFFLFLHKLVLYIRKLQVPEICQPPAV